MARGRTAAIAAIAGGAAALAARAVVDRQRRAAADEPSIARLHGRDRSVTTPDGVRLHVEVDEVDAAGGDRGATLVFVHGFAMSLDCWHYQRAHFRDRRRVVLYDHRSHGRSSSSDADHLDLEQLGADLRQVVEEVAGDGPVVLVGHSMGGMTIMSLAEQHPELFGTRVVGVALVATAAGNIATHSVAAPFLPDRLSVAVKPGVLQVLRRLAPAVDVSRSRLPNATYVGARIVGLGRDAPAEKVALVARDLQIVPTMVVLDLAPTFDDHHRYDALATLARVPTLVVTGSRDIVVRPRHSRDLHAHIPGSRLVELTGPGHCVMIEQDAEVNALLDDLVAEAEGR